MLLLRDRYILESLEDRGMFQDYNWQSCYYMEVNLQC